MYVQSCRTVFAWRRESCGNGGSPMKSINCASHVEEIVALGIAEKKIHGACVSICRHQETIVQGAYGLADRKKSADARGCALPDLFDDKADHGCGDNDALGTGCAGTARSGVVLYSLVPRETGRSKRNTCAGEARYFYSGSFEYDFWTFLSGLSMCIAAMHGQLF